MAPTRRLARRKACLRQVAIGALTLGSVDGRVSKRFSGRVGSHVLAPGSYVATKVATDATGQRSSRATARCTVARR